MTRRQTGLWAVVLLGVALAGCRSDNTMQPTAVPDAAIQKSCMSDEGDIGPEGGSLNCGPYTLTVPAGALSYTAHLKMTQEVCGLWPVQLSPDGTQFAVPATLSIDATGELLPQLMSVAWWSPSAGLWIPQLTLHAGSVCAAQISHFSRWTIN